LGRKRELGLAGSAPRLLREAEFKAEAMSERILIFSTHPDDETLGCGGTVLRHAAAGDELYWLIVTVPHAPRWSDEVRERKAKEIERVAQAYGVKKTFKLGFPAAKLETVPQGELMDAIRVVIDEVKPTIVYLIHGGDVHTDHHAAFSAAMCVIKPFYMRKLGIRRVLSYETISSTDAAPPHINVAFIAHSFVDITPHLQKKLDIMSLFESETHPDPMPRGPSAIRALARFRGATVSVEYAEAFMLVREVL
jgi:N-acetylglucosamine malate deacetylase 1